MTELPQSDLEAAASTRSSTAPRAAQSAAVASSLSGRIGTDESGKGDYFGPLVIAAVWADPATEDLFRDWGVADSKKISDGRARSLAKQITDNGIPTAVVTIGPEKYNQLYGKMKNLNRLLAWGHARAIENLLEKASADVVVTDQFGDPSLVENALLERGRRVTLNQMHQGERDIVVAAASVMARAEFLRRLESLSQTVGLKLPKGAGPAVDEAGASLLARGGMELLGTVAKCHFKNTQKAEKIRESKPAK
jgi:ribonuclease HIII